MTDFTQLAERVTARLKRDPELRLEVSRELEAHLEDCAAEHKSAGKTDAEAREEAVHSLGKEEELSDQLWQANRRRISLRLTARWAAGVIALPAVSLAAIWLIWGTVSFIALFASVGPSIGAGLPPGTGTAMPQFITKRAQSSMLSSLTADQRRVVAPKGFSERLATARELAERRPDDTVLWANYCMNLLLDVPDSPKTRPDARASIEAAIKVFERGRVIEPDNAFYPLMIAAMLTRLSAAETDSQTEPVKAGFDYVDITGKSVPAEYEVCLVADRQIADRALQMLHEAAGKPYCRTHIWEFAERTLDSLSEPASVSDLVLRLQYQISVLLPYLSPMREAISQADYLAILAAEAGDSARAMQVVGDGRNVSRLLGKDARVLVELLVAYGRYDESFLTEAIVQHKLGNSALRDQAIAQRAVFWRERNALRSKNGPMLAAKMEQAGTLDRLLLPAYTDPNSVDFAPARRLDYLLLDRLFVSILLLAGIGALLLCGARAIFARLRTGKWQATMLLNWTDLGRVVFWSTLLPLAVYTIYTRIPAVSGRNLNAYTSFNRIFVEYAVVFCAVIILFRIMTSKIMLQRASQLAIPELQPCLPGRPTRILGWALGLLAVAYIVGGHMLSAKSWQNLDYGHVLAILLFAYGCLWIFGTGHGVASVRTWRFLKLGAILPILIPTIILAVVPFLGRFVGRRADQLIANVAIAVAIASFIALMLLFLRNLIRNRKSNAPAFSAGLSLAAPLLVCMLVLCGATTALLKVEERDIVRRLTMPANKSLLMSELERNHLRVLRDRMQEVSMNAADMDATRR